MSLSRPLKSLKIRLFSTFQISVNPVKLLPQKQKNLEELYCYSSPRLFLCLDTFTLIYVNLDFSLAETFALKLDKSLCPVIHLIISQLFPQSLPALLLILRQVHGMVNRKRNLIQFYDRILRMMDLHHVLHRYHSVILVSDLFLI